MNSNIQNTCCSISYKKTYTICNLYIPPSQNLNITDFDTLLSQLHSPFVILGDLNAHNILWGYVHIDIRGRLIERVLNIYNLCILNDNLLICILLLEHLQISIYPSVIHQFICILLVGEFIQTFVYFHLYFYDLK